MENQSPYALLDRMNQAAVVFSAARNPVFVTAEAARKLQIKNRDQPDEYAKLVAPLLKAIPDRSGQAILGPQRAVEIVIHNSDGVPFAVLATSLDPVDGEDRLVYFWDLRPYQTWLTLAQQTQRLRPALVYASALLGQPLNEAAVEALFRHTQLTGAGFQEISRVDLLTLLTIAVEIVDSLAPSTFKIGIDLPTSALLSLSRVSALRLVIHLFLEAVDFSGPLGKAKVGAFFQPGAVHVMTLASRPESADTGFGPLELHLQRKAVLTEYRVGTGGKLQDAPPEEIAFLERQLGPELNFDLVRALPEESYSENLRIASHVADGSNVVLDAKLVPPRHLLLSMYLPLEELQR